MQPKKRLSKTLNHMVAAKTSTITTVAIYVALGVTAPRKMDDDLAQFQ